MLRYLSLWVTLVATLLVATHVDAQFRPHARGTVAVYGVDPGGSLSSQIETQFRLFGWRPVFARGQSPASEPLVAELYFIQGYGSAQPSSLMVKGPRTEEGTGSERMVWMTIASDRFDATLHPRVVALRAAELLRASLGVTEPEKARARPPLVSEPESTGRGVTLGLDAGAVSSGLLGPAPALMPRALFFLYGGFNLELFASVPVLEQTVSHSSNSADARVFLLGASLGNVFEFRRTPFQLGLGLGAGAAVIPTTGRASLPDEATDEIISTGIAFGSVHLTYPLGSKLRFALGGRAGVALPKAEIRLAGESAGEWGLPFFALSLGLQTP